MIETFYIIRKADESGVSGTGKVLNGCIFPDGTTVIRWCVENKPNSTVVYETYGAFREIHIDSHPNNQTEIVFETKNVNPTASNQSNTEPCKACCGKGKYSVLDRKIDVAKGTVEDFKQNVYSCKRCNGTGIEPITESVSRPIENKLPEPVINKHPTSIQATIRGKPVEPTTESVSSKIEKMTEDEWAERKDKIDKEITPDPYKECANELDPLPETIQGMEVVVDHKKVIEILKKYLQPKQ